MEGDRPGAQKLGQRFKVSGYPTVVVIVDQAGHDQQPRRLHSVAIDTSVALTSATTSRPGARPSSFTERVGMTGVTIWPDAAGA